MIFFVPKENTGGMIRARRQALSILQMGACCLLFVFSSLVPASYLLSYAPGVWGAAVNLLKFVPPIVALFLFFSLVRVDGRECRHASPTLVLSIIIYEAAVLVSSLGAVEPLTGLSRDVYYAVTGPLVALAVSGSFRGDRGLRRLLETVFWTGVVVSVYGILEFALERNPLFGGVFSSQNPLYAQFASEGNFGSRILSSVGHPVFLGTYFLLIFPIGLLLISEHPSKACRNLLIGGVLCLFGGLLLTFSRGAWVGFGTAGAVYGWLRIGTERQRRIPVSGGTARSRSVALVVVGGAVFIAMFLSFDRVSKTLAERGTLQQVKAFKTDPRGVAYSQVAGMAVDHPFLGTGTAHYRYLAKRYGDYDGTPDNGYLRVLGENGILGLGTMIALFVILLKGLFLRVRGNAESRFHSGLATALAASFSGFYVNMITCDALQFPLTRLKFWMLAGVAMSMDRPKNS